MACFVVNVLTKSTVLRIERHSIRNGKSYEATSFYLSSMETRAQRWQQLV